VADSAATKLGVKLTTDWQEAAETVPVQVLEATAKSAAFGPLREGVPVKVTGPLVMVRTMGPENAVAAICTLPNVTVKGAIEIVGVATIPVPLRETV
jgi:hypothetical protein